MKFIKENVRLVVAVVIALILITIGVILLYTGKDKNKEDLKNPIVEQNREEKLENATGMSKEDAIEIVKENFGSDNYEFSAVATKDGMYKVVVKNTIENTEIVYYVDPSNGTFYVDLETK